MEGFLGFLVIAVPAFFIIRHFVKKANRREAFAALPADGPMKVEIEEKPIPAGAFSSKHFKCSLSVDVKISQADWKAIADAGLMKKVIFQYPSTARDPYDPDNRLDYRVEDLKTPGGVCFGDTIQMQEAKEHLIFGLKNLREQIDNQRGGPRKQSFEI